MTVLWSRPALLGDPATAHLVVEASAGTGKTWFVTRRVIDLLLQTDATIDQIVVVTYTEKATAELRLRLRALLTQMAHGEPEPPPPGATGDQIWTIDDDRRGRLLAAIEAFDTAPTQTSRETCRTGTWRRRRSRLWSCRGSGVVSPHHSFHHGRRE